MLVIRGFSELIIPLKDGNALDIAATTVCRSVKVFLLQLQCFVVFKQIYLMLCF